MSVATWYHSQYSTWNRTLRIQRAPYIARTDTNTSRTATAMAQGGDAIINMGNVPDTLARNAKDKDKKKQDALFGPTIGVVNSAPSWTTINEKKVVSDELTSDIVNTWIEKSKEAMQPTTTLQALVNLKRPTLRLSPLASESDEPSADHHHGLEFEYDCDAPKCGIYVNVLLPPDHPEALAAVTAPSVSTGLSKILVFETVVPGGFGKILKLEEGAMLELGRFEYTQHHYAAPVVSSADAPADSSSSDPNNGDASGSNHGRRKRFTNFHFRKQRPQSHSVSGPALAVVDAEPATNSDVKAKDDDKEGVRVTIRLAALDEQGAELTSPNEQVTYLHVVRFGVSTHADDEEDKRPWVVKVVKREATIGPHTFSLYEIYGLSSSSNTSQHTPAPTAPLPIAPSSPISPSTSESHTYPPTVPQMSTSPHAPADDSEPSSECLVCLSSPREVVLLPCRHLVACKECALNMVEFGAGGNITQAEEAVTTGGDATEAAAGDAANPGDTATPTPAPAATPAPRRKRKAKGWFCPVCRQPYTSLLRITTNPPPLPASVPEAAVDGTPSSPAAVTPPAAPAAPPSSPRLGFPSFFSGRSLSIRNPPADLESGRGPEIPVTL